MRNPKQILNPNAQMFKTLNEKGKNIILPILFCCSFLSLFIRYLKFGHCDFSCLPIADLIFRNLNAVADAAAAAAILTEAEKIGHSQRSELKSEVL